MADPFTGAWHEARVRARRRQRARPPESRLALTIKVVTGGVVVVTVAGEVDLATRAALTGALTEAIARPDLTLLVCDLTRVGFLACTGVSALAQAESELAARGAVLRVVAAEPVVLRALEITGQREALGVRPDLTAALAGFVPVRATPPPLRLHGN